MKKGDEKKTKEQLLKELNQLHRRIGELESEEKFRSLIENIPDVTWTTSSEGITTFISSNIEKVSGCTPKEVYEGGKSSWLGRIHPDDTEKVEKTFELLFTENKMFDIEYRIQRKDGEWIWAHNRAITTYKKDGVMYADGIFSDITKRKKAEEALRESEQRYRTLYESNKDGIAGGDVEGNILECNQAFADVLGYTKEEIKKMTYQELTPKKWHKIETNIVKNQIIARGYSDEYEKEYIKKDGTILPVSCKVWLRKDEKGEVVGMWGIVRDITERKKAEEVLRESEERLRLLIESAEDVILMQDIEGKYLHYSGPPRYGIKPGEVIGKTPFDFHSPENAAKFMGKLEKVVKSGKSMTYETPMDWRGEKLWFIDQMSPIKDSAGNVKGVVTISRNITEHKKAEETLRESEEKFRKLFKSSTAGIAITTLDGKFLDVNDSYLKMLGYTFEELKKLTYPELTPEKWHEMESEMLSEASKTGHSKNFEKEYIRKDGTIIPILVSAWVMRDQEGNPNKLGAIVTDITERKKAEEKLTEYNKRHYQSERLAATGRLAASVAHEINNPLQAISFNLGFVKNAVTDDFKEKRSIEQIEVSTKRIKSTIKQLLDIHRSKVEVKEKVNVNESIEAALNLLKNQLMINKIKVNKSLSINIPLIIGITQELFQVFMNLILNAQDAMERGGILNISTKVKDNKLRIIFEDNGCGISDKDMDYIFEPFHTTKSAMLGTGLGLSTSKGIIESFSGKIDVKSMVGKGSIFTITFPIIK